MELFVIDRSVTGSVRRALYQKYRAADSDIEGLRDCLVGQYGFKTVLRFH
jgi:hypothetical protein